uniref:Uncharacterized protein n=1 Tax=Oryza sativa subsp. japonica TaxID=39947 RepID=Q6K257_ORYSJ|nr:hypothetical protein [Oryza sativa Japonica Group]BAD26124.1 hypothetical protein [Oryza sativa Japonica Group]
MIKHNNGKNIQFVERPLSNGQIEHTSKICRKELEKNGAKAIGSFVCFFHGSGDLACANGDGEEENMAKDSQGANPVEASTMVVEATLAKETNHSCPLQI